MVCEGDPLFLQPIQGFPYAVRAAFSDDLADFSACQRSGCAAQDFKDAGDKGGCDRAYRVAKVHRVCLPPFEDICPHSRTSIPTRGPVSYTHLTLPTNR